MKLTELLNYITPFPWRRDGVMVYSTPGELLVFRTEISGRHHHAQEAACNAEYLNHAAKVLPELVEAVKNLVSTHDKFPPAIGIPCDCGWCKKLRPLLARAENVEAKL